MSIKQRLGDDLKAALRAQQSARLACVRMLKAKLQEREVELRGKHGPDYEIADDEALAAITSYAKQRRDSIAAFEAAGRADLAAKERAELEIVSEYLPRQLGADELREIVRQTIAELGVSDPQKIGEVMRAVLAKVKGQADGKRVNEIARELLAAS